MPVHRTPWGDFPNVVVHTNLARMRAHPAYAEAKEGNLKAARVVVRELFKAEAPLPRADYVAPVVQLDVRQHWNALPMALALQVAERIGARIVPTIVQKNVVHHTGADAWQRVARQPEFTGVVPRGTYVLVDDVVTFGSTLANLRGHMELHGGRVVAASTLASGIFAARLKPDPAVLHSLQERFGHELALTTRSLGFPPGCLTSKEAWFLRGLAQLAGLRGEGTAPACAGETSVRNDAGAVRSAGLRAGI
ncbi:MAG TPA: phosphoribosyltransferase [Opitutaceae bacterium]|nr:phosphoribosyltransferase [Opitutaceae bacterium]